MEQSLSVKELIELGLMKPAGDVKTIDTSPFMEVGGWLHYENKGKLSFEEYWEKNKFPDEMKEHMKLKWDYPMLSDRQISKMIVSTRPSRQERRKQARLDKKKTKVISKRTNFKMTA